MARSSPAKVDGRKESLAIRYVSVGAIQPAERNARTHTEQQVSQLAGVIQQYGWTNPILVDEHQVIIAGHGRLAAAQQLGLRRVPTIALAGLTNDQKRALALADNKLALNAGWDEDLLRLELAELDAAEIDIAGIGWSDDELNALLNSEDFAANADSSGRLSEAFGVPPFSVLNARAGWWQDRKRAWISLGIQSELGRGAAAGDRLTMSETIQREKPSADQAAKRSRRRANATPGGSNLPAADYSKRQRGDGRGRAVA